ncbi:hypothetical protein EYF80_003936 [Liparis tanakae]|uniref:Uncharacterized protein n=1 Tax=Liparis tanakae TaxID=230148 RepID=A0A4Z2J664_9TELE|nr:hypothetical protein EYF80_003936 [Liparis tanakae]
MTASPFGAVPAVVAGAVVGGSMLIIPQNPSQMSPSLGGRWAGAPLCRSATVLAALQTCWQQFQGSSYNDGLRSLLVDEGKRPGLSLIHIHIQVQLGAQVEVEEGVDAEDEEQDRSDDQERILKRRGSGSLSAGGSCSALHAGSRVPVTLATSHSEPDIESLLWEQTFFLSPSVPPSALLPTYPDCPATRTAPRQPALAAASLSVPTCLLVLLRRQLYLRPASQPGTWEKEEEEERENGKWRN